jgi:hypothetical protein
MKAALGVRGLAAAFFAGALAAAGFLGWGLGGGLGSRLFRCGGFLRGCLGCGGFLGGLGGSCHVRFSCVQTGDNLGFAGLQRVAITEIPRVRKHGA